MIAQTNVQTLGNTNAPMRIAANHLADQLSAAEAAIDAAVAAVATLTAAMPLATQQANVGTHVLQESLMHAMETCQQLVKARTNILRTHKALSTAQHNSGLGHVALMDPSKCEDRAELATSHLSIAAAA